MRINLKSILRSSLLMFSVIAFFPSVVNADTCLNPSDNPCWVTKTPMPTVRRDLGVATDGLGKVYAVGGHNGSQFLDTLEVYNPATDSWTTKSPVPVARNDMGFTFNPVNGKFYLGGGYNNGLMGDFYEYDPVGDIWTVKASLPTASAGLRFAAANGKIYSIGGGFLNGTQVSNVEEYDPTTNQWVIKSSIPTPRADAGLVTASNGKIYLIGGGIEGASIASVEEYDPITDTWLSKAPLSGVRADMGASLNANGNIYAVGGSNLSGYTNLVEEYNIASDTWTTRTSLPAATYALRATFGGNGKVYVMGGQTATSAAVNTNYAGFTPEEANQPPTVGNITVSVNPVIVNSSISATASFTDPNISDMHTASWNWGDGNITTGTVTESNGSGSVSSSHAYSAAGVYTITLTVTDNNGAQGTSVYQYLVVYDPAAGFITGSGKYNSLLGWYTQNPLAVGEIKFGMQAKYTTGNAPTGQTKWNFSSENVDFVSTSYQWLVVSGAKATLKGNGAFNGTVGYTFLTSVIDGSQTGGFDKIRFQIKDLSGSVVYDTQSGDPDTADPTTSVTNGKVKVH